MQYVPCYYQNQVLSLISLWKDEAFKDGFEDEDFDLVFGTTEELSYRIKLQMATTSLSFMDLDGKS